jgi:glycosyltransferase involved in cell wall biosynthesis
MDTAYFHNMAMGLTERGHAVSLVTLGPDGVPESLNAVPNVACTSLGVRSRTVYPWAIAKLARQLRTDNVDICHAHLFDGGVVGVMAARLAHGPVSVLGRHHHDHHQMKRRHAHVAVDRLTAQLADCTVAPSKAVREHMRTVERVDTDRIEVIHYGFDYSAIDSAAAGSEVVRKEHGLETAFIIGFTGRLVPDKGLDYLLEATRMIEPEIPQLKLMLVGDAGSRWLQSAIAAHDLSDRVVLVGFRRDVPRYMAAMDLAVHPSLSDSFPQALIEAMAVETPVIATDVGGIPEIVSNDATGILVQPRDAPALAQAIRDLYQDPDRRRGFARAGMQAVRERFTLNAMITRHLALYESLCR